MADVSLVNSGSPTKPLSQFMLNNRVEPPVSADAPGRPGDWAVDGEKLYICLAPNDWSALALVRVGSDAVAAEPAQSDPAEGAEDSGEGDASEHDADKPADEEQAGAAE